MGQRIPRVSWKECDKALKRKMVGMKLGNQVTIIITFILQSLG
jgi:hypothetical protein